MATLRTEIYRRLPGNYRPETVLIVNFQQYYISESKAHSLHCQISFSIALCIKNNIKSQMV